MTSKQETDKYLFEEIAPNQVEVWEFEERTMLTAGAKTLNRLNKYYKKVQVDSRGMKDGYIIYHVDLAFDGYKIYKLSKVEE